MILAPDDVLLTACNPRNRPSPTSYSEVSARSSGALTDQLIGRVGREACVLPPCFPKYAAARALQRTRCISYCHYWENLERAKGLEPSTPTLAR